jgi:hypothetical protein
MHFTHLNQCCASIQILKWLSISKVKRYGIPSKELISIRLPNLSGFFCKHVVEVHQNKIKIFRIRCNKILSTLFFGARVSQSSHKVSYKLENFILSKNGLLLLWFLFCCLYLDLKNLKPESLWLKS